MLTNYMILDSEERTCQFTMLATVFVLSVTPTTYVSLQEYEESRGVLS